VCNNSGSVAVPQKNIMTVKGESIVLQCLFKGNLQVLDLSIFIFWKVSDPLGKWTKRITDNSTYPYHLAYFQTCSSDDGSCCEFANRLLISKASLEINGANFVCIVDIDGIKSSSSSTMSELNSDVLILWALLFSGLDYWTDIFLSWFYDSHNKSPELEPVWPRT